MITHANLAEQLRDHQLRSEQSWATLSFFSSTANILTSEGGCFSLVFLLLQPCSERCPILLGFLQLLGRAVHGLNLDEPILSMQVCRRRAIKREGIMGGGHIKESVHPQPRALLTSP
ncbi:hypothetical protein KP509_03G075500 [Ceratopteris richardii]|uniref:Uncharacterized protein n=1 Tax=Ceratopteris richardii TaxID=49495 RepID=A0A8T2V125_CERRI|nr:hypothetical protein KP509_03G075500 [Ceratopteris richardii]